MKEISEHSKHIDALEQAIFGADYERFKQTLVLIRAMSKTARKFFLSRVNDFFTGKQEKPKKQGNIAIDIEGSMGIPWTPEMAKRIADMGYAPGETLPATIIQVPEPAAPAYTYHVPAPDTPGSYDTAIADAAPVTWTAEEAFDEDHRGK